MQMEEEIEKKPIETVHFTTPPNNQTFKRLIRQLRDARKEVAQLKTEAMSDKEKMKELMDGNSHTLDLERFVERKAQSLYRYLQNLYRKNRGFQSQNRKLKAYLQHFRDEVAQRNLHVLVEAAIEKDTSTVKDSIAPIKKFVIAKKKKHIIANKKNSNVPNEYPPSTRKSVRLTIKVTK